MALKNEILSLFERQRGVAMSGTQLAERFDVSRNAVWKAVNALKDEGHDIETVGKKGYMLKAESDVIYEEGIRKLLPTDLQNIKIFTFKQTTSTNDEAKSYCMKNPDERAVFISEQQTAGRGRFGRSFYSPPDTGLYLSAVFHPHKSIENAVLYTAAAAVAAARAIENESGIRADIKWVNDLYLNGGKICGTLTEAMTDFETGEVKSMIVGIGINVSTVDFPEEIRRKAACLGDGISRSRLAAGLITELFRLVSGGENFLKEYRERSFLVGREIVFFDGNREISGTVEGVTDGCALLINSGGEVRAYSHGEVRRF